MSSSPDKFKQERKDIMKEITINGINGSSIQFAVEDNSTIAEVCAHQTVCEFFDEDADTIKDNLIEMNEGDVSRFRATVLTARPNDGDVLLFDLDGQVSNDGEDEDAEGGEPGIVVVATSGGLQTTNVAIICGRTTVHDAIYRDEVRARSGMSDAQLSNCNIILNDETISESASHDRTLRNGDTITLSARAASSKGMLRRFIKAICR